MGTKVIRLSINHNSKLVKMHNQQSAARQFLAQAAAAHFAEYFSLPNTALAAPPPSIQNLLTSSSIHNLFSHQSPLAPTITCA